MDARTYFQGKKITVMGLGLLGRGVGDTAYLARQGAELIVTDLKSAEQLAVSVELLAEFPNITYVLGEHRMENFEGRDYILKAAGVPLDSPYIAHAKEEGIRIKMSASWFAEIAGVRTIGVTGTRGKSTVTHMIEGILKENGMPTVLGGNIRGVSTLALLEEVTPSHIALFELDSWQCQGWGEEHVSPNVAVFTTFFADHMNYYHDDLKLYLGDKANIFLYQRPEDTLILGAQCESVVLDNYHGRIPGKYEAWGESSLPKEWHLPIPGDHNRYNAALALGVARTLGIEDTITQRALESFSAVSGRLELVRSIDGIDYYNDTNATTPDATLAALEALSNKPIILIMGGADKGLAMDPAVGKAMAVKRLILLSGTGTDRLKTENPQLDTVPVFDNLAAAFNDAHAHAQPGDVIVLSPAFASFGMFKNEYDRGDQFDVLVKSL